MRDFFRYPQTPHLAWLGPSAPRNDKVLDRDEAIKLLDHEVTVEEKLDGANLGISLSAFGELRYQNRGQFLQPPFTGQFARLNGWATQYGQALATALVPGLILFGEWLAARHSVKYDRLPGWFVAFDVHDDGENAFWSTARRDNLVGNIGLPLAPCLLRGRTNLPALKHLVMESRSRFGDTALEGLVVRNDNFRLNEARAKLVRPDFVQSMEAHWRRRALDWNRIASQV
jgi:ATP-dependent RNA circularization protein (DNA/RNA ligase family)